MSAMHHGAVMEGSWGSESTMVADADAALALLRAELQPGDVVLVKASRSIGLEAVAAGLLETEASRAAIPRIDALSGLPDRKEPA